MRIYKRSVIITGIISIVSLAFAIILNYVVNEEFWCNVCLGLFGSSFLTLITSIIGYFVEKRNCMDSFYIETKKFLNKFNRYQIDLKLEDKIAFFLEMADYDKTNWDMDFGKMDFFNNKQREYIYYNIYTPLIEARKIIADHAVQFRMHTNKTGKNEPTMFALVENIEKCFLSQKKYHLPMEDNNKIIATEVHNRIVEDILKELNGRYYKIMNGKKKALKKEIANGKTKNADRKLSR